MDPLVFEASHLGTRLRLTFSEDLSLEANVFEALAQVAFEEAARIDAQFSRFRADSELMRLNRSLNTWTPISDEMAQLLHFGLALFEWTQGGFDLQVFSILTAWGYGQGLEAPDKEALEGADSSHSDEKTALRLRWVCKTADPCEDPQWEAFCPQALDLGGLGKGYAVDRMRLVLQKALETRGLDLGFLLDAGGDLWFEKGRARDEKGEWIPWRVALEHPLDPTSALGEVSALGPLALAGSSALRRQWTSAEGPRHHLVDPRTKQTADAMLGVFVESSHALWADAFATAFFVLGYDAAQELFALHFKKNAPAPLPSFFTPRLSSTLAPQLEVLLISPHGSFYASEGFQGKLYTAS